MSSNSEAAKEEVIMDTKEKEKNGCADVDEIQDDDLEDLEVIEDQAVMDKALAPSKVEQDTTKESNKVKTKVRADRTLKKVDHDSSSKKTMKPVQNWRKVLRLPPSLHHRLDQAQVFQGVLPTYVPHVPKGTSQRLIDHLTQGEVDLLCCPGCRDRFILPTTFFQHIFRRSLNITFSCQGCKRVLSFNNNCHLRMHILSHMEVDGISSVGADFINIEALAKEDLDVSAIGQDDFKRELDMVCDEINQTKPGSVIQCSECHVAMSEETLANHFSRTDAKAAGELECPHCAIALTNSCSLAAHIRIHQQQVPRVCPECGMTFDTLSVFRNHVESSCLHESKTLLAQCQMCCSKSKVKAKAKVVKGQHQVSNSHFVPFKDLLSHVYDSHVRLFFKCSSCPKAFGNKSAIYGHRDQVHKDEKEETKSEFSILYKATFISSDKGNLFSSREALESKLRILWSTWPRRVVFRCFSCLNDFNDAQGLESHNQKWCGLRNGKSVTTLGLFQEKTNHDDEDKDQARARAKELIQELKTLIQKQCVSCEDSLARLESHIETLGHDDQEQETRPAVKRRRPLRSMSRQTDSPKPLVQATPVPPNPPKAPEVEKKALVKKQPSLVKEEMKPLVESLGKDLPSPKKMLAFNRLGKRALALGSSVIKAKSAKLESTTPGLKFVCALCNFGTDLRESFQTHIQIHKPANAMDSVQCKECGMSFASEPAWAKHLFLLHKIKAPAPMDLCRDLKQEADPFAFQDNPEVTDEILEGDEGGVSFKARANVCSVCACAFSNPLELRRHFRSHGMAFLRKSKGQ